MPIDSLPLLCPQWPHDEIAAAFMTTRRGGFSEGCYGVEPQSGGPVNSAAVMGTTVYGASGGLNLGTHVGDDPAVVARNRATVTGLLPAEPLWLDQVHSAVVLDADKPLHAAAPSGPEAVATADAAVSGCSGRPLVIMTADCLPVLFVDAQARVIGAAHAGWRGLAAGVLENTVAAMAAKGAQPARMAAWLGAAIGPQAFETGDDVRAAFVAAHRDDAAAFHPIDARPGKWFADLYQLARWRLQRSGVTQISGESLCTVRDRRFYSYRRDGVTGRMGAFIWLR